MAFTKKISSVLNNLQSNIPSGFGSMLPGGLSNLASKVASTAQTNKVAAKLLNKSPLETSHIFTEPSTLPATSRFESGDHATS